MSMSDMGQIERIRGMEALLNECTEAVNAYEESLERFEAIQQKIKTLSDYYGSDKWKSDFEADEAGLLPRELRRGVLSEDAIWNVLTDSRDLNVRMLKTVADIIA